MTGAQRTEQLPKQLGGYLLRHHLGQGGMGEVFLAERLAADGVDATCVVKTVRADLHTDAELLSRFEDEARVAMRMTHPNIARVFDFGLDGEVMFLAMELVDGGSVEDITGKGAPIPEGAALQIVCDILAGLDYAHRAVDPETGKPLGVVHRDVSPANALVHSDGVVKLIDFGLAMSAVKQTKTADGSVVLGKLAYASPETSSGRGGVDHRTDQYSAAIICYELLTGDRYYGTLDGLELWRVVSDGGYRPPKLDELKPVLKAVLGCALSASPAQRFSSCGEFRAEIARVLEVHHEGRGRQQLMALYGLELADDAEDPATLAFDADEARAIAAVASGAAAALIPPQPGEATVVTQMLAAAADVDTTRVVALEEDEATVAGVGFPSDPVDAEATIAGEPPPLAPPVSSSATGAALPPSAATEAAMPALDLPFSVAAPPPSPPSPPSPPPPVSAAPATPPPPVVVAAPKPAHVSQPQPVAPGAVSGPQRVAPSSGRGVGTPVAPDGARVYRPPMVVSAASHDDLNPGGRLSTGKLIALLFVAAAGLIGAGVGVGLLVRWL